MPNENQRLFNSQTKRLPWCWRYRMFYVYPGGITVELLLWYTDQGQHFFHKPQNIDDTPVLKITAKNKVNFAAFVHNCKNNIQLR